MSPSTNFPKNVGVSGSKKCLFYGKFNVLCFLETPVLKLALLPYYRHSVKFIYVKVLISQQTFVEGIVLDYTDVATEKKMKRENHFDDF